MKTRIVEREDIKTMPSITALHGPKGVLGNQEIRGGLQFCVIEEICEDECERHMKPIEEDIVVSNGDHAHACITVGGGSMGTMTARIALGYILLRESSPPYAEATTRGSRGRRTSSTDARTS